MLYSVVLLSLTGTCAVWLVFRRAIRQQRVIDDLKAHLGEQTKLVDNVSLGRDLMFASNPNPMWVYDCQTLRFLQVNDAAVNIYGYRAKNF